MSIAKPSSYLTTGVLGGSFLWKLVNGNPHQAGSRLKTIHDLEVAILGIASGQYLITLPMADNVPRLQRWRYADWLVTTPLLLRTFHLLAQEKGFEGSFSLAFGANVVMVLAGYFAEYPETAPNLGLGQNTKLFWYVLGFAALSIVLLEVARWNQYLLENNVDTGNIPTFFYLGWTIYGLNFATPVTDLRQTGFNILDLFNKGVYTFELDRVISENF